MRSVKLHLFAAIGLAAMTIGLAPAAHAGDIITDWGSVKRPAAPTLKPAKLDAKTTALLMLDFMHQNCGKRPECVASVPAVKKLLAAARAANATVIYSTIPHTTTKDVIADVAPVAGEASVTSGPDKFINTDLAKMLKDKGIKTVITVGTSADGAVLYTASGAALRGMNVIVPVDGMSSANRYADLVTAWLFTDAPLVSKKVTLTKLDMVSF